MNAQSSFARLFAIASVLVAESAAADPIRVPWMDEGDLPPPKWARSVAPKRGDLMLYDAPERGAKLRGVTVPGTRLPFFGTKRGAGCMGRYYLVGPLAWACSDIADLSPEEPDRVSLVPMPNGLAYSYYFAGRDGAQAYKRLDYHGTGSPDRELEPGWAVAIVEQQTRNAERWGRTSKGQWIRMSDLYPARPPTFSGAKLDGRVDVAFVLAERATVYSTRNMTGVLGVKSRFETVRVLEERTPAGSSGMVRIARDGQSGSDAWMLARDLRRPTLSEPPKEVLSGKPSERWIDISLDSQTLVAYEGRRPVFATLVSTGRGAQGTESATPIGVHRIWVKIFASTMDNVERDDVGKHYSMEDVPYVQFFHKAVALHGTYWHRNLGRIQSHGCVNLAPLDAKYMFEFTSPKLPDGWHAVYPSPLAPATVVRVRR